MQLRDYNLPCAQLLVYQSQPAGTAICAPPQEVLLPLDRYSYSVCNTNLLNTQRAQQNSHCLQQTRTCKNRRRQQSFGEILQSEYSINIQLGLHHRELVICTPSSGVFLNSICINCDLMVLLSTRMRRSHRY